MIRLTRIKDRSAIVCRYPKSPVRGRGRRRHVATTLPRDSDAAVDFVDQNVSEGRSDKTACIDLARNLTYSELGDATARLGPVLARIGIETENRIAHRIPFGADPEH